MDDLAATLSRNEQDFAQLTGLEIDKKSSVPQNLATFIAQDDQLGLLSICASGTASDGTKIISTTAYVSGTPTNIDVCRQPLTS
jgi:alcohol dehydrogenase YqhD (iron-dependent ADH family)